MEILNWKVQTKPNLVQSCFVQTGIVQKPLFYLNAGHTIMCIQECKGGTNTRCKVHSTTESTLHGDKTKQNNTSNLNVKLRNFIIVIITAECLNGHGIAAIE